MYLSIYLCTYVCMCYVCMYVCMYVCNVYQVCSSEALVDEIAAMIEGVVLQQVEGSMAQRVQVCTVILGVVAVVVVVKGGSRITAVVVLVVVVEIIAATNGLHDIDINNLYCT